MVILLVLLVLTSSTTLSPSTFSESIKSSLPDSLNLITIDLGRTVNGFSLMAYGLTGIKNLPKQVKLEDLSHYPSCLLLSSWTTNNENSVNLLYGFAMHILRNYE